MSDSVKHRAIKGVMWSAVERFSVQGIQFVLSIVIARLVLPSEYGLIAMLGIFLAIAQTFVDSGFSNALIQKKDRTEVDYSTVFYFNIIIALVVYGVLFDLCPLYRLVLQGAGANGCDSMGGIESPVEWSFYCSTG